MKNILGLSIPQTLEEVCHPQRVALLVYDMQLGILSQIKKGDEVTQQVLKVLTGARDARLRVFFSRHLSLPKELMGMSQFRVAMAWQRIDSPEQIKPWFLRDDPSFQIIPELAPRPTEGVFDKLTMSAFEGTWLDFALRDCGIKGFIIVGVATEIGIEPTICRRRRKGQRKCGTRRIRRSGTHQGEHRRPKLHSRLRSRLGEVPYGVCVVQTV